MPLAYIHMIGGATDPGFGGGMPAGPGIDNSLPGSQPGIDNSLPDAPVFPPPTIANPIVPIPPGTSVPPGTIYPPVPRPPHVSGGPVPPHVSGQPVPPPAGTAPTPTPPIAGTTPPPPASTKPPESKTFWMLAYCPSLGWKYVVVDPSLDAGMPLPPTAQPK